MTENAENFGELVIDTGLPVIKTAATIALGVAGGMLLVTAATALIDKVTGGAACGCDAAE